MSTLCAPRKEAAQAGQVRIPVQTSCGVWHRIASCQKTLRVKKRSALIDVKGKIDTTNNNKETGTHMSSVVVGCTESRGTGHFTACVIVGKTDRWTLGRSGVSTYLVGVDIARIQEELLDFIVNRLIRSGLQKVACEGGGGGVVIPRDVVLRPDSSANRFVKSSGIWSRFFLKHFVLVYMLKTPPPAIDWSLATPVSHIAICKATKPQRASPNLGKKFHGDSRERQ